MVPPISKLSFKVAVPPSCCRGNYHSFFVTLFTWPRTSSFHLPWERSVGSVLSRWAVSASILLRHLSMAPHRLARQHPFGPLFQRSRRMEDGVRCFHLFRRCPGVSANRARVHDTGLDSINVLISSRVDFSPPVAFALVKGHLPEGWEVSLMASFDPVCLIIAAYVAGAGFFFFFDGLMREYSCEPLVGYAYRRACGS